MRWHDRSAGKYRTKTVKGSKQNAQTELRRLQCELDQGTYKAPNRLTVAEGLRMYLKHKEQMMLARRVHRKFMTGPLFSEFLLAV